MRSVLGPRELNRALLERQLLLRRADRPVAETVEHLVGLQAQAPLPPYLGLWSRLRDFDPHELGRMLTDREVVRLTLMRGTVHLVTPRDAGLLRPLVQVVIERSHNGAFGRRMGGAAPGALADAVRELLADGPLTAREIASALVARGLGDDVEAIGNAVRTYVPLVQLPPRGHLVAGTRCARHPALRRADRRRARRDRGGGARDDRLPGPRPRRPFRGARRLGPTDGVTIAPVAQSPPDLERVRAAEVIGALSLATDLGMGLPFEHGLQSTLFAARLSHRLGVDDETTRQTYYACLLFHSGCTTDADLGAEIFGSSMTRHHLPVMFGSQKGSLLGVLRSLPPPGSSPPRAVLEIVRRAPRAARELRPHVIAACEVAQMLAQRVGLPAELSSLFAYVTERWDGNGPLGRAAHDDIPLPVRIVHVAQDAAVQRMLGGSDAAARVVREHAGHALDPAVAECLADNAAEILALPPGASAWEETLDCEPAQPLTLEGEAIDRALSAMGDFADLASPYLSGHSAGVAAIAEAAARRCGFDESAVVALRRAAAVHDIGRIATPVGIWHRPGPLSPDDWEQVRLHAYHSERVLLRSPSLAPLAAVAGAHHERLDGSGYHRGTSAAGQPPPGRLLATVDAYHAMTEPRPHREAMPPARAAESLGEECRAGRFDADLVAAVLEASGQPAERIERPAGLTEREVEVLRLLARGLQTKHIAATLGISPKTADRHIQNAYAKIDVSTRAAATLFAMEYGLMAWGEFPISRAGRRS